MAYHPSPSIFTLHISVSHSILVYSCCILVYSHCILAVISVSGWFSTEIFWNMTTETRNSECVCAVCVVILSHVLSVGSCSSSCLSLWTLAVQIWQLWLLLGEEDSVFTYTGLKYNHTHKVDRYIAPPWVWYFAEEVKWPLQSTLHNVVHAGLEPPTPWFPSQVPVQLSYCHPSALTHYHPAKQEVKLSTDRHHRITNWW